MKLFELFATLGIDTSDFDSGISGASKKGKSFASTLNDSLGKTTKGLSSGIKTIANGANKIISTTEKMAKTVAVGLGAAGAAFGKLAVDALGGIGRLEQNIGGIETLFGGAYGTVYQNAQKAFETAGMDANTYMETATGFAASLLQSVGGNTMEAARLSDMAIRDMSDNANKMGTDMSLIQYAYQGFAKQNYTMLDNLKLGYGGTKTEMERLLADAEKLTGKKYSLENLNDVFEAVHAIQEQLGITGTTAKEAAETLEGSGASAKAAWKNFLSGAGTAKQVAGAFKTYIRNISKNVKQMLPRLTEGLSELVNELGPEIPALLETLLPSVFEGANILLSGLFNVLPGIMRSMIQTLPTITGGLKDLLGKMLGSAPEFVATASELFNGLMNGLMALLPQFAALASEIAPALLAGILTYKGDLLIAGLTILQSMLDGLASDPQKITDAVSSMVTKISEWFSTPGNLSGMITNAIEIAKAIAAGFTTDESITAMSEGISALIGALSGDDAGNEKRASAIGDAIGNIKTFIVDLVTWLSENKSIIEGVAATLVILWAAFNPGLAAIAVAVAGIVLIAANWESVKTAVSNAWDTVKGFFEQTIPEAWNSFIQGIVDGWSNITSAIETALGKLREFIGIDSGDQSMNPNNPYGKNYHNSGNTKSGTRYGKATGLDYVPYNNFPARLHEGEAVLTKSQASDWRTGGGTSEIDYDRMGSIVASSVASALHGVAFNIDGQRAGEILTKSVSRGIQREALAGRF